MQPSNKRKFNKYEGSLKNFPIPQYRFDSRESPILKSKSKCSYKIKTILSQQEELQLISLTKALNTKVREAVRISLSKVSTIASNELEKVLPRILANSKIRGHTARDRRYEFRIPREEKDVFKKVSSTLKLSEQATLRLIIIYVWNGIKDDEITELEGCRLLSQEENAEAYFKNNPKSSGKLDALKKARDEKREDKLLKNLERYVKRGKKITQLIDEQVSIPYVNEGKTKGKIDLKFIDKFIQHELEQEEDEAFKLFINEIHKNNEIELTDREKRIERHIFSLGRLGIEITREEAIQLVEDEMGTDSIDKLQRDADEFMDEYRRECNLQDEQDLSNKLGHPLSDLPIEDIYKLKKELEESRKTKDGDLITTEVNGKEIQIRLKSMETINSEIKSGKYRYKSRARRRRKR